MCVRAWRRLSQPRPRTYTEGIMSQHPPETPWNDRVVASDVVPFLAGRTRVSLNAGGRTLAVAHYQTLERVINYR